MDERTLADAIGRNRASRERFQGLEYARLRDTVAGYRRGSLVLPDGSVIPGYPSIGRVQSLGAGLRRHYSGAFWVEEKIDGFNVRIFRWQGRTYAATRGGYICAFSTDRLPDLLDSAILDDEPDLVLCAEIAGPENPYLEGAPPGVAEDVAAFVFDMMRTGRTGFLAQGEKMARLRDHGLPSAPIFGRFLPADLDALQALVLRLDAEGSEGVVLKGEQPGEGRAKYVTGRSNVADIELCGDQLLDLPPEYFTNRLLRLGLFVNEHAQAGDADLERRLGRALINGVTAAVDRSRTIGRVGRRFRCRFRQRRNAEAFMAHIKATGGQRVRIDPEMPRREGAFWVLEFERILERMTGTLANALSGASQYD
ncbi:RNA ligase [Aquisalimonas lutea]|uniref:RNA ligase n=1 Tax=Aquisalimonas lutea TaxID=1327750 RepID=UPI0025B306EC|nr:RNA ligase [Aquisalimonas lutea]MDN3519341.1 RNA ligase [Aquisalimonas lutea]